MLPGISRRWSAEKRKRFHGTSCEETWKVIVEIMAEQHLSMTSFVETSDSDAFLCHSCDAKGARFS